MSQDDKHKPLFFSTIKWVIMASIVVSIIWLCFAFVYSETYAKNKEIRAKEEAAQKGRNTKFRTQDKTDPAAMIEPKVRELYFIKQKSKNFKPNSSCKERSIWGILPPLVLLFAILKLSEIFLIFFPLISQLLSPSESPEYHLKSPP